MFFLFFIFYPLTGGEKVDVEQTAKVCNGLRFFLLLLLLPELNKHTENKGFGWRRGRLKKCRHRYV